MAKKNKSKNNQSTGAHNSVPVTKPNIVVKSANEILTTEEGEKLLQESLEQIEEAGLFAQSHYPDVIYWTQNWRKGGLSERRIEIIKEYNFYNQRYCGCEFSMR